eukprot:5774043-Prymnesium_polylepis.1
MGRGREWWNVRMRPLLARVPRRETSNPSRATTRDPSPATRWSATRAALPRPTRCGCRAHLVAQGDAQRQQPGGGGGAAADAEREQPEGRRRRRHVHQQVGLEVVRRQRHRPPLPGGQCRHVRDLHARRDAGARRALRRLAQLTVGDHQLDRRLGRRREHRQAVDRQGQPARLGGHRRVRRVHHQHGPLVAAHELSPAAPLIVARAILALALAARAPPVLTVAHPTRLVMRPIVARVLRALRHSRLPLRLLLRAEAVVGAHDRARRHRPVVL